MGAYKQPLITAAGMAAVGALSGLYAESLNADSPMFLTKKERPLIYSCTFGGTPPTLCIELHGSSQTSEAIQQLCTSFGGSAVLRVRPAACSIHHRDAVASCTSSHRSRGPGKSRLQRYFIYEKSLKSDFERFCQEVGR